MQLVRIYQVYCVSIAQLDISCYGIHDRYVIALYYSQVEIFFKRSFVLHRHGSVQTHITENLEVVIGPGGWRNLTNGRLIT